MMELAAFTIRRSNKKQNYDFKFRVNALEIAKI